MVPSSSAIFRRRLAFFLLVTATVVFVSWAAFAVLQTNGLNVLKSIIFGLFVILLLPLALSFWTAVIGFMVQERGGDSFDLTRTLDGDETGNADAADSSSIVEKQLEDLSPHLLPRTAVVMPVYNENPERVFAGLKSTYESLERTGFLSCFDLFLLSDTTDPDLWVQEEMAFMDLRAEVSDPTRLFFRNRRANIERKSGNIADFCVTWGERYRYMIVLDADSIMTGRCLVNLVRLMEKNPRVGIVQAPPLPVNRRTLFGRLYQFAMHVYSSIFISGLNFWQGGAANYWGHNAIIRIRPFVKYCRLPKLSGKQPLGGSILSHDFVEAAFMRRAGWKVYLASELRGSYEELPSSLIGYAARDRRWCEGNVQHARLLFTPGLHYVNRLHLWMGVMAYASSPLWILMLVLSAIEGIRETLGPHAYFPARRALFPEWQISVARQSIWLFTLVMTLLMLPKLLSLVVHLRDRARQNQFGGRLKLAASVLLETLASTLLAPNMAYLQTRFLVGIFMGKSVKWEAQHRGETGTSLGEAIRRHWVATLLGLLWSGLLLSTVPKLFWWFSPVCLGLSLSIPLSVWTSRTSSGVWARRHRLFLIPEELQPPEILRRLHEELDKAPTRRWAEPKDGLTRVLADNRAFESHLALMPRPDKPDDPLFRHHLQGLQLKFHYRGLHSLTPKEKRELLLDPESIRHLRYHSHGELEATG
jgi:membrane glycosyltransferase